MVQTQMLIDYLDRIRQKKIVQYIVLGGRI